jgi:hypothetical protein
MDHLVDLGLMLMYLNLHRDVSKLSNLQLSSSSIPQRLAQTQFAHLEEVVRNIYDIIPKNLFKIQAMKTIRSSLS